MIKIVMCVRRRRDREMAADEARFIDLASSCVFFTEEREVF